MDLGIVICLKFFFLHGRLVSISRFIEMDFDSYLYVFKGWTYHGFLYASFWERYTLVNVLLWPMTAIACFVGLMVAEGKYTVFTRFIYFVLGE